MSNYIYFQNDRKRIFERFPDNEDIRGRYEWREYYTNPAVLLNKLREFGTPPYPDSCPRLFISHRQVDDQLALRVAQIASTCGFEYWVDVLDPGLRSLDDNTYYTKEQISILTACIIEMALINCTHVITLMTPNTRGSQWVPYEYGRITEIPSVYERACAWKHPLLSKADLPEYMDLGIIAENEHDIISWLNKEYAQWMSKSRRACNGKWEYQNQQELPG